MNNFDVIKVKPYEFLIRSDNMVFHIEIPGIETEKTLVPIYSINTFNDIDVNVSIHSKCGTFFAYLIKQFEFDTKEFKDYLFNLIV